MGCVDNVPSDTIYLQKSNFSWKLAYTVGWGVTIVFFVMQSISILFFTNPNLKEEAEVEADKVKDTAGTTELTRQETVQEVKER